jgi:hypothetical protein
MTWVEHIACACEIRTYKRLITKKKRNLGLNRQIILNAILKEIGCENVVCSTDFEVESIVRILCKI